MVVFIFMLFIIFFLMERRYFFSEYICGDIEIFFSDFLFGVIVVGVKVLVEIVVERFF